MNHAPVALSPCRCCAFNLPRGSEFCPSCGQESPHANPLARTLLFLASLVLLGMLVLR